MKAEANITITDVKNANELDQFVPVEGAWYYSWCDGNQCAEDVEEAVKNYMDADYDLEVKTFRSDGRAIEDEFPGEGTFLAVRK